MRRSSSKEVRDIYTAEDMIYAPKKSKRKSKRAKSIARKMKLMR